MKKEIYKLIKIAKKLKKEPDFDELDVNSVTDEFIELVEEYLETYADVLYDE